VGRLEARGRRREVGSDRRHEGAGEVQGHAVIDLERPLILVDDGAEAAPSLIKATMLKWGLGRR
jgi:hypothetical protein